MSAPITTPAAAKPERVELLGGYYFDIFSNGNALLRLPDGSGIVVFSEYHARAFADALAQPAPDATPAQPVSAAGSEPVAWRGRDHMGQPWTLSLSEKALHQLGFVLVEPLYTTPTPALAPQDGGPDVLPGLKLALELMGECEWFEEYKPRIRAEIVRREGAST